MYSVAVFFENSNTKQYQLDRPYFYVINEDLYEKLAAADQYFFHELYAGKLARYGCLDRATFTITNDFGYDYSNSRTLIFPAGEISSGAITELKQIKSLVKSDKIVKISEDEYRAVEKAIRSSRWFSALGLRAEDETGNTIPLCNNTNKPLNIQNVITIKGESNMFENIFKNLKIGPVTNGSVRMSMLGLAVASKDRTYVAYDPRANDFVDATDFLIDGFDEFIYSVPVSVKDIVPGDFIFHGSTPVRVVEVLENGNLSAQNITEREVVTVIPVRNVFGFKFYAKVVNLFGNAFGGANDSQPFGNMLPLLFLKGSNGSKSDMLPMILAMGGMNGKALDPMMLMALLSKGGGNDMLPFLLLSQNAQGGQNPFASLFGGMTAADK